MVLIPAGLSILEEIRALEETQQAEYKSCCIIWTGNCSAEDQANYLTAGFDACIGKPLPPIDELGARIFHLLDVTYDPSRCLRRAPQSTNTVDCGLAATRASVSTRDARTVTSSFESELVSTLQQFWFDYVECQRLEVGHLLYQNFFNQHPEHVEIFTRRKGRSNLKSVAVSSRRAALFMHMLSSTVLSMHDFDTLAERATRIASTHVKYGIPLDAYFDFLEAIESALQSKLPSHFTRSVRFAFRVAFSRIAAEIQTQHLRLLESSRENSVPRAGRSHLSHLFRRSSNEDNTKDSLADRMRQQAVLESVSRSKKLFTARWRHALSEIQDASLDFKQRRNLLDEFLHDSTASVSLRYFLLLEYSGDATVTVYLLCDKYRALAEQTRGDTLTTTLLELCHEIADPVDPSLSLVLSAETLRIVSDWLEDYTHEVNEAVKHDMVTSNLVSQALANVQKEVVDWLMASVIHKFKSSLICHIMLNPGGIAVKDDDSADELKAG